MYRLLFFIVTCSLLVSGCNYIESDIDRVENKLEEHNNGVKNKIKLLTDIENKSEKVLLNYERFIHGDYYDTIMIEDELDMTDYLDSFELNNITMSNLTINPKKNIILQTIRINGTDRHMYVKIYWDSTTGEMVRVVRRVTM